jgi:hypothetical protein
MLAKAAVRWHMFPMMKSPAAILIAILAFSTAAFAQNNNGQGNGTTDPNADPNAQQTDRESRNNFWEASLPGGTFLVALGRISSVSRHKYVLDGALIVDEVTVDTTGQALARFYFISPITADGSGTGAAVGNLVQRAQDLVDNSASQAGTDVQNMVVKKYPLTTHAKTIEYRLLSEAQLGALYQSARTAWVTGKGRVFTGR